MSPGPASPLLLGFSAIVKWILFVDGARVPLEPSVGHFRN